MNNTNNIIYISSNLSKKEKKKEVNNNIYSSNSINNQLVIDGIVYVSLSLEVYGWLRQQMDKAHAAYQAGKLTEDSWKSLREKFYPVHDWVVATYGVDAVEEVLQTVHENPFLITDQAAVNHPAIEHIYPLVGNYSQFRPVPPEVVSQVDVIRDKAISLGWKESALYQNRGQFKFPCDSAYGLVCFLDKDSSIGEISRQYIEIVKTLSKPLRFYNKDVAQPWITRL